MTTDKLIDAALDAFNAGFNSKAGQKQALADLGRAYDIEKRAISDQLLSDHDMEARRTEAFQTLYWGLPDFHNWKAKHSALFTPTFADAVTRIERLAELRNTIKAAPITPPVKREISEREVRARETIEQLLKRRGTQYENAIRLGEIFGGLPVSANSHWVVNEHGTQFIRTFWYLRGELTPLNLIIAAAEELERRAEASA